MPKKKPAKTQAPTGLITLAIPVLRAALRFTSKEETRYYLNGVFFQSGLLVSTDGHRMAVLKPEIFDGSCGDFIMPSNVIEKIITTKLSRKATGFITVNTKEQRVYVYDHKPSDSTDEGLIIAIFPYRPIDGTFPEWKKVFPAREEVEKPAPATFNSFYLSDFTEFGKFVRILMNGNAVSPTIIRGKTEHFDAIGLLMPAHHDIEDFPLWFSPSTKSTTK